MLSEHQKNIFPQLQMYWTSEWIFNDKLSLSSSDPKYTSWNDKVWSEIWWSKISEWTVAGSHYFWGLVRNLEIQNKKGDNSEVPGGRKRNIVVLGGLSALLSLRGGSWKTCMRREQKIGKVLGSAWGEKVDCWAVVKELPPVWKWGGCAWPVLVHLRRNIQ